jgi:hypothetical protein
MKMRNNKNYPMKPRRNLTLCLCLILTSLTTACGTDDSRPPVTAKLFAYSPDAQTKALAEINHLPGKACARDVITPPCSVLRRMMSDYQYDRNQMRVLGAKETP